MASKDTVVNTCCLLRKDMPKYAGKGSPGLSDTIRPSCRLTVDISLAVHRSKCEVRTSVVDIRLHQGDAVEYCTDDYADHHGTHPREL